MDLLRFGWLFVRSNTIPWIEDRLQQAVVHWHQFGQGYKLLVLSTVMGGAVLFLLSWYRLQRATRRVPLRLRGLDDEGVDGGLHNPLTFDVCVVGGGPAGCSCAFYLASAGARVLLLEKDCYPRDKICGTRAQLLFVVKCVSNILV
jgi:hypothetical protein